MVGPKTPSVKIRKKILYQLSNFPMTAYELSVATKISFKAIQRNLKVLEELGKVEKEYSEGLDKYLWKLKPKRERSK